MPENQPEMSEVYSVYINLSVHLYREKRQISWKLEPKNLINDLND